MGITAMRMSRFFYLLGQGIKNIFTHGFMSFASVAVITACLFIMARRKKSRRKGGRR